MMLNFVLNQVECTAILVDDLVFAELDGERCRDKII